MLTTYDLTRGMNRLKILSVEAEAFPIRLPRSFIERSKLIKKLISLSVYLRCNKG